MKIRLLLLLLPLLTSCGTILNKSSYPLKIRSNAVNASVKVYDSVYPLPAKVQVTRSKEDLDVTLITDTLSRTYHIPAIYDRATLACNILTQSLFCPIGIIIDHRTEKGFYYRRKIFLDINDTIYEKLPLSKDRSILYRPIPKGHVNFTLSLPWINSFHLQPPGIPTKNSTGCVGASAGLEYYYKDNRFIKFTTSGVMSFPAPVPVPILGEYDITKSFSMNLTHNHRWQRFIIGYGPSWQENEYDEFNEDLPDIHTLTRSIGLTVNGYYRLGRSFHVGLIYSPSIYNVYPKGDFNYQHVISLDLMWKIKLWGNSPGL